MVEKTHNPFFLKIYKAMFINGNGGLCRWGSSAWNTAFGYRHKLPLTTEDCGTSWASIYNEDGTLCIEVQLLPIGPKGTRKHRVTTFCNKCKTFIPAGRIHQHKC